MPPAYLLVTGRRYQQTPSVQNGTTINNNNQIFSPVFFDTTKFL